MNSFIKHPRCLRSHFIKSSSRYFASVTKCDALVLGGGIGGASLSYRLAKLQKLNVICLEKEESPGYHATGKAFGIFAESNARGVQSKLLTAASRPFFEAPDEECMNDYIRDTFPGGILQKTGLLAISSPNDYSNLYEHFGPTENIKFDQNIQLYPQKDVTNIVPFLNTEELGPYAIYEPNGANFNIGLVYEHFLVGGNEIGVKYYFNQSAVEMSKNANGNWEVSSYNAETNTIDKFEAGILVNCTGQWADETAEKAGIKPLGLVSLKRNIIVFTYKKGEDEEHQTPWLGWVSPDAGEILFHSCFQGGNGVFLYDQVDMDECVDVEVDTLKIVLQTISKHTTLKIEKIATQAAGIRFYAKQDKNIVIGPAEEDNSFVWCAALGGIGVQTAPAYSEIASYLAVNKDLPKEYVDLGIDVDKLLPARLYHSEATEQKLKGC